MKQTGRLQARMREYEAYVAGIKSRGQVGKLVPSGNESARGVALRFPAPPSAQQEMRAFGRSTTPSISRSISSTGTPPNASFFDGLERPPLFTRGCGRILEP